MRRPLLGLAVVIAAATATPAHADVVAEYFKLPADLKGTPQAIDAGPDGTVYFGTGDGFLQTPPIARLDPALASPGTANGITWVDTPDAPGCCAAIFRDLAYSAKDQQLYWTRSDNVVGRLKGQTVDMVAIDASPWGIVASPDGGAWFTEYSSYNVAPYPGNRIAQLSSTLGVNELGNLAMQTGSWDGTRYDAKPRGITLDGQRRPWFTQADAGNPGYRIATPGVGLAYTELRPCPTSALCSGVLSGTALSDIALGRDGWLWYTNQVKRTIGRLSPETHEYAEFTLASMGAGLGLGTPRAIRAGHDGTLWATVDGGFSSPGANAILKIAPAAEPAVTVYRLGAAQQPFELAPDTKGNVWFVGTPGTGGGPLGRLANAGTPENPGGGGNNGGGGGTTVTPGPDTNPPNTTTVTSTVKATATLNNPNVKGTSLKVNQVCVGPPQDKCSLVYLIDTNEYVKGFPGTKANAAAAKRTTIGKLTITLKGGQSKKVTIKLNAKGKKLLKKMKKFKARLTVTQKITGQKKPKTVLKKNVSFRK